MFESVDDCGNRFAALPSGRQGAKCRILGNGWGDRVSGGPVSSGDFFRSEVTSANVVERADSSFKPIRSALVALAWLVFAEVAVPGSWAGSGKEADDGLTLVWRTPWRRFGDTTSGGATSSGCGLSRRVTGFSVRPSSGVGIGTAGGVLFGAAGSCPTTCGTSCLADRFSRLIVSCDELLPSSGWSCDT
jgi:hypothetical protein